MKINNLQIDSLGMLLIFLIIMTIIFWMMSKGKSKNVTQCFTSIIGALPISKIFEAIIEYFKNKHR